LRFWGCSGSGTAMTTPRCGCLPAAAVAACGCYVAGVACFGYFLAAGGVFDPGVQTAVVDVRVPVRAHDVTLSAGAVAVAADEGDVDVAAPVAVHAAAEVTAAVAETGAR
jgi:hypothetical protein